MALAVFISVVLQSCFVLVVAALVSALQVMIGRTTAVCIFVLLSPVMDLFLQVTSHGVLTSSQHCWFDVVLPYTVCISIARDDSAKVFEEEED